MGVGPFTLVREIRAFSWNFSLRYDFFARGVDCPQNLGPWREDFSCDALLGGGGRNAATLDFGRLRLGPDSLYAKFGLPWTPRFAVCLVGVGQAPGDSFGRGQKWTLAPAKR